MAKSLSQQIVMHGGCRRALRSLGCQTSIGDWDGRSVSDPRIGVRSIRPAWFRAEMIPVKKIQSHQKDGGLLRGASGARFQSGRCDHKGIEHSDAIVVLAMIQVFAVERSARCVFRRCHNLGVEVRNLISLG